MTPTRNIIVLFAPGLGGNHLANMISTDARFQSRASESNYQTSASANAHFYHVQNLDLGALADIDTTKSHVLCGHWGEYYWAKLHKHILILPNRHVVIMKVPTVGSTAYDRMIKYTNLTAQYLIEEQRSLYTMDVVGKIMDEFDLTEIESELLFCETVETVLESLSKQLALNLDLEICRNMHTFWYDKMNAALVSRPNNHTHKQLSVIL